MAVMPGVLYKPIGRFTTPMAAFNRVNLHIAVSEAASLYGYFVGAGRPCSHFYVRRDGTIEQYVDTRYRAAADYQGNDATISVETQGMAAGNWTPQQVASLARIWAWARDTHGLANRIANSSRIGAESKGLSYHRFGIDPWRVADGMKYSTARGKICPTDARIAQVGEVFALSQAGPVVNPVPTPTPTPTPTPKPTPAPGPAKLDEDGMWGSATTRRAQQVLGTPVDGEVWYQYAGNKQPALVSGWVWNYQKGKGSSLISQMMTVMARAGQYKGKIDGVAGTEFYKALQRRYGVPTDGELWKNSLTIKRMQAALNAGRF